MAASTSFVFKLHYDDGPVHVSRRYGYVGRIDQPQVYSGLYDRTSQVLSLPNGTFTLALKDSLGNPKIKLESFQSFKKFVCKPLLEDPNSVKIDEKGRRVLVFIVEKKKNKEKKEDDEETALLLKSSSSSATVNPRLASPSSRSVQTDSTLTTTTEGGGSVVDSNSPLSTGGKNAFDKLTKRFEPTTVQVQKPGYHTAYSTPTTITSPSSSSISTLVVDEKKKEKEESWGTVKGMLENFVKDLNLHLADTFGDEASSFRLKTNDDDDDDHSEVVVGGGDNNKGEEIKTSTTPDQNKALHPHVFCDRCLKTISGSRFKCRSCSNYDLCQNCIDFKSQFHPGVHTFSEILKPGSIPLPTTRGSVVEIQQLPLPSIPIPVPASILSRTITIPPTTTTTTTSSTTSSVRPIIHSATCDVCQKTIIGTRMKCLNCPDYDLCSNCFNDSTTLSSIHPNHSFVSIHHPKDLKLTTTTTTPLTIHHHIRCDGCGKSPIKGNRFKCMMFDCKDFDLCQDCESDPIPRHPQDHVLSKIKKPINQLNLFGLSACGGINNGGGGRENFNETVKRAQEIANRGGGVSSSSSSSSLSNNVVNPISSFISSIGTAVVQAHTTTSPQIQATTTVSDEKEKKEEEKVEPFTTRIEKKQVKEEESESESEQEEKVEDENFSKSASVTTPEEEEEEEGRLGCSFVADVTLKDGTIVPAGSEFNKIWKIKNTGTLPWNQVKLVNVGGLQTKQDSEGLLNLKPGEEIEVLVECKAPEEDGRFMSFFRLQTKKGLKFGDRFWLDITVESEGISSSRNLSSSSIITPCLNVGGKSASTVPETITTSSVAPSTTFSLSSGLEEEESEFESIQQGGEGGTVQDSEEEEEEMSESESEESSELEEDSDDDDDEFVVLSEEDR